MSTLFDQFTANSKTYDPDDLTGSNGRGYNNPTTTGTGIIVPLYIAMMIDLRADCEAARNDGEDVLADVEALRDEVEDLRDDTADIAAEVANIVANSLTATSTTSNDIGTGSKTWTVVEDDKPFAVDMWVKVCTDADPTVFNWGNVTGWNSGTKALQVNVTKTNGAGTGVTAWSILTTGPEGVPGTSADIAEFVIANEILGNLFL